MSRIGKSIEVKNRLLVFRAGENGRTGSASKVYGVLWGIMKIQSPFGICEGWIPAALAVLKSMKLKSLI